MILQQAGGISAFTTIVTVSSAAGLPYPPFYIKIDSEIMTVIRVNGNQLVVQRGSNRIWHPDGSSVSVKW
jgi:hypothetical protein